MIYTVHSRQWYRDFVLHELALRRIHARAARRRTPGRWLTVR